jgi:hypothetical protein
MKNLCTGLKVSRTLVSLDLSSRVKSQQKNHFGISGARILGEDLSSDRCLLTHLALEGCSFGNEGLRALFGNLRPESTLLSLNLACNDLDARTPSFNYFLRKWLPRCLHSLDLSDNPKLGDPGALILANALNDADDGFIPVEF